MLIEEDTSLSWQMLNNFLDNDFRREETKGICLKFDIAKTKRFPPDK